MGRRGIEGHTRAYSAGGCCEGRLVIDGRRRRPAPVIGDFLLILFLHIVGRLRRCVEVQGMLIAIPHDEIAFAQQILHRAAVGAFGYLQGLLNGSRAEGKLIVILIATQIKIQVLTVIKT